MALLVTNAFALNSEMLPRKAIIFKIIHRWKDFYSGLALVFIILARSEILSIEIHTCLTNFVYSQ